MPADNPIPGPIPIYVRATPGGVSLDLEAFTKAVVEDVLQALLEKPEKDPEYVSTWDLLHEVAELTPETAAIEAERGRLPYEELVAELTARSSKRIPLYGEAAVVKLIAKLRRAVRRRDIPQQRGAAA